MTQKLQARHSLNVRRQGQARRVGHDGDSKGLKRQIGNLARNNGPLLKALKRAGGLRCHRRRLNQIPGIHGKHKTAFAGKAGVNEQAKNHITSLRLREGNFNDFDLLMARKIGDGHVPLNESRL